MDCKSEPYFSELSKKLLKLMIRMNQVPPSSVSLWNLFFPFINNHVK